MAELGTSIGGNGNSNGGNNTGGSSTSSNLVPGVMVNTVTEVEQKKQTIVHVAPLMTGLAPPVSLNGSIPPITANAIPSTFYPTMFGSVPGANVTAFDPSYGYYAQPMYDPNTGSYYYAYSQQQGTWGASGYVPVPQTNLPSTTQSGVPLPPMPIQPSPPPMPLPPFR
jgi:hypothetical protein